MVGIGVMVALDVVGAVGVAVGGGVRVGFSVAEGCGVGSGRAAWGSGPRQATSPRLNPIRSSVSNPQFLEQFSTDRAFTPTL